MRDLLPKGKDRLGPMKCGPQEAMEMWRCLGALERLPVSLKKRSMRAILNAGKGLQDVHFWVLGRLGARRLFHGPADAVIPAAAMEPMIPEIFKAVGGKQIPRMRLFALANICRLCGIRDLDLSEATRKKAGTVLKKANAPGEWQEQVARVRETSRDYETQVVGDTVPLGLRLDAPS
jgi:hypothetical protein